MTIQMTREAVLRRFARQFAGLRKRKGLRHKDLALQLGVATATISRWENGHHAPSRALRLKLNEVLGMPLEDAVGIDPAEWPNR